MPEIVGEYVDRLVTVEMHRAGERRGIAHRMYEAAREAQGGKPLTYLAAKALEETVKPGDFVLLMLGAGKRPWRPWGETDGPIGVASLARSISMGLGAIPVIVAHERHLPPTEAATEMAGVSVIEKSMAQQGYWFSAVSEPFPVGPDVAEAATAKVLDTYSPTAIVSIEKLGPNAQGVIHGITGLARDMPDEAYLHVLVDEARRRGILTIGIGDGGNELGYGKIRDAVREIQPYGAVCQCPCGGGIATVTETDVLVHAAISNWGAYGVSACLAYMKGNVDLLQTAEQEREMLVASVEAGAEGGPGHKQPWVDNTDCETQQAVVTMLRMIVSNALTPPRGVRPW